MTTPSTIYLVSPEKKDLYCLQPLVAPLRQHFETVSIFEFGDALVRGEEGELGAFLRDARPLVLVSQVVTVELLSLFRSRGSFEVIGIEHGIAPYKSYTYGSALLGAEFYLSPTRMWHERLCKLYPASVGRLRLGGYPRISALAEMRTSGAPPHPATPQAWLGAERRRLAIFSWGVDPEALRQLPDDPGIVYLLHPADHSKRSLRPFQAAALLISEPELAASLLSHATEVYGDFSSLTLEAIAMRIPAYIFLDRALYSTDCDLAPAFFDRASADFASIPHTGLSLTPDSVLDLAGLRAALAGGPVSCKPLCVPAEMLPPEGDNREATAREIASVAGLPWEPTSRAAPDCERLRLGSFIARAYHEILGREPDAGGLMHYTSLLEAGEEPRPARALKFLHALAESAEGQANLAQGSWAWPLVSLRKADAA